MLDKDVLQLENIFLHETLTSKQEIFERIAEIAFHKRAIDCQKDIVDGLFERENQSTTGFLDGFAIPHVISNKVNQVSVFILKNEQGIDWESMDGQETIFFIALLIPEESQSHHLKILSSIAKLLMDEKIRQKLLQAANKEEIYGLLTPAVYQG
ncbi:PTS sugar transporter subunit IIA [Oceanobacillus timonensis]|uniref:PTS sugar transporter subunit IIA n=1 Tax=Oceanobacillus timonensis TaxID=1926285 RepID=UPI0009BAF38C|nr:PTS sugar transporter subunit IIA [Oceanobacillus timonensis]